MKFVWLYVDDEKNRMDLFISMLSVHMRFRGTPEFVVVGDIPSWFSGTQIPMSQVSAKEARTKAKTLNVRSYVDTMVKMHAAATAMAGDTFCWMMDDQVFCRQFWMDDIYYIRTDPDWKPRHRIYDNIARETLMRIPGSVMCATHMPQVFSATKMLEMYDYLGMPNRLAIFDAAYGNFVKESLLTPLGSFGVRVIKAVSNHSGVYESLKSGRQFVVNWTDEGMQCKGLRQYLKDLLCLETSLIGPLPFASSIPTFSL